MRRSTRLTAPSLHSGTLYISRCCGSGFGAFLSLGSGMGKKSDPDSVFGSGMKSPDHISESLEINFKQPNT